MRDRPSKKDNLSQYNHLVRPGSFDRMGEDHPAALGDCEEEDAFLWQPWSFLLTFLYNRWKSKARPARTKESKMSVQTHRSHSNTLYSFRPITHYLFLQHSTADRLNGQLKMDNWQWEMPTWKASLFLCKSVRSVKFLKAPNAGSAFKKRQSESIQSLSKTGKLRPDGRRSPGRTWWLWRRWCLFLTALIFFAYFFISR